MSFERSEGKAVESSELSNVLEMGETVKTNESRVPTGIASLDKIIDGGFNVGDNILVAGQPGAGKSTLGAQFLYNGAVLYDQTGVYVTFVESGNKFRRDMLRFGWDFADLERQRKVMVLDLVQSISKRGIEVNFEAILTASKTLDAKRLVIDSLSALTTYINTKAEARSFVALANRLLEDSGCTAIMMVEMPWGKVEIGAGFEEFMADGLMILESKLEQFKVRRRLYVPKMRGTNHALDCFDFYITSEGIKVSPVSAAKE
ncbi:AAA family ATPase [Candidatus Bathyarchaeota archaeon]|nr:AAA family ATPase [Candidatus Bathyarchaeota archaeon]